METTIVTNKEYEYLKERDSWLQALQDVGVDSWDKIPDAHDRESINRYFDLSNEAKKHLLDRLIEIKSQGHMSNAGIQCQMELQLDWSIKQQQKTKEELNQLNKEVVDLTMLINHLKHATRNLALEE